jgi:hypothetical protein
MLENDVVDRFAVRQCLAPDVEEPADVRMVQRRNRSRFPLKTCTKVGIGGELRGEDLDSHGAAEPRIARAVNLAHSSGADECHDFVRADMGANSDRHGSRWRRIVLAPHRNRKAQLAEEGQGLFVGHQDDGVDILSGDRR